MPVHRLSEMMINQIAAGEVVERPASVVKELIENAIDAGASDIKVVIAAGGKNLIRVTDNGRGMGRDDLILAIERHCTSKISNDLMEIRTLGFRGEALPSIGSVAKLSITSRQAKEEVANHIEVNNGIVSKLQPAALSKGTIVDVFNLFANVPARLKFLKTDRGESNAITQIFKRMALAFPEVKFSISGDARSTLEYAPTDLLGRISQVLGAGFQDNAMEINAVRENVRLKGYASLPTFNRGNAQHQYFFVNGRPVRDKSLLGAVRGAYSDFLVRDRHAVLVLFLECEPGQVDVNVHPAKADVRFRDGALVRGLIVGSLKQAISLEGFRTSSEGGRDMMAAFKVQNTSENQGVDHFRKWQQPSFDAKYDSGPNNNFHNGLSENQHEYTSERHGFTPSGINVQATEDNDAKDEDWHDGHPLGAARVQLHENYIVTQTNDGLIIVDQHAAHERIVYEKLKSQMKHGVAGQSLLIPEVIELAEEDVDGLGDHAQDFLKFGLLVEKFGPSAIIVRETPALLGEINVAELINDLVDELAEWKSSNSLVDRLEHVAATIACHGSIRSGRWLKGEEMNALLRQMESTPNSGQCNHGRPTYIELKLKDIERLFGR